MASKTPQFVAKDNKNLKGETVELVLVRVDKIPDLLAEGNPKLHDIGATWESVKNYNFNDPSKIDMNLTNVAGTKGAFVYGNGRNEALYWGWTQYQQGVVDTVPNGIRYDDDYWYIPVMIGVDTNSEFEAKALMIDHNNLTVMGGDIDISMIANLYDKEALALMTKDLGENMQVPITFDGQDIDALFEFLDDPDFDLDGYEDSGASVTGQPNTDDDEGVDESGIRMVQLFLNADTIEQFSECVKVLSAKYDIKNVTDVVLEALKRESEHEDD